MILLSYHLQSKVQYPICIIIVPFLPCCISAFVYGWIAIQCQYSIIPPTMMHFIWNRINPLFLGSPEWMNGEQWKINVEDEQDVSFIYLQHLSLLLNSNNILYMFERMF
jgi:hypothetical protein